VSARVGFFVVGAGVVVGLANLVLIGFVPLTYAAYVLVLGGAAIAAIAWLRERFGGVTR